jgi:hypothetical protein
VGEAYSATDFLGSPELFLELRNFFLCNKAAPGIEAIRGHFFGRRISHEQCFKGCWALLIELAILTVAEDESFTLSEDFLAARTEEEIAAVVLARLVKQIVERQDLAKVFSSEHLKRSENSGELVLCRGAFPPGLANFKWLLISLGFLQPQAEGNFIVVEKFSTVFLGKESNELESDLRGIDFDEFKKRQIKREKDGLAAEEFVMEFEGRRLGDQSRVFHVSPIDVGRGYDIHTNPQAGIHGGERLIEVKSFSGCPHFFLSQNEVKVAKNRGSLYFLYLVCRDEMEAPGYEPIIYQNPFQLLFNPESLSWAHTIQETHHFVQIGNK